MTGDAVFRQAMRLLGYTNAQGEVDGRPRGRAVSAATALGESDLCGSSAPLRTEREESLWRDFPRSCPSPYGPKPM